MGTLDKVIREIKIFPDPQICNLLPTPSPWLLPPMKTFINEWENKSDTLNLLFALLFLENTLLFSLLELLHFAIYALEAPKDRAISSTWQECYSLSPPPSFRSRFSRSNVIFKCVGLTFTKWKVKSIILRPKKKKKVSGKRRSSGHLLPRNMN